MLLVLVLVALAQAASDTDLTAGGVPQPAANHSDNVANSSLPANAPATRRWGRLRPRQMTIDFAAFQVQPRPVAERPAPKRRRTASYPASISSEPNFNIASLILESNTPLPSFDRTSKTGGCFTIDFSTYASATGRGNPVEVIAPAPESLRSQLNCDSYIKAGDYLGLCRFLKKVPDAFEAALLTVPSGDDADGVRRPLHLMIDGMLLVFNEIDQIRSAKTPLDALIANANLYRSVDWALQRLAPDAPGWAPIAFWFNRTCLPSLSCIVSCCQKSLLQFEAGCAACSTKAAPLQTLKAGCAKEAAPLQMRAAIEAMLRLEGAIQGGDAELRADFDERIAPGLACLRSHFGHDLQRFVLAFGPEFDCDRFLDQLHCQLCWRRRP